MKLPGITYDRPVQRLGRRDITAPLRLANVQAAAAGEVGKLAQKIEASETATTAAHFQTEMAEMNANMKNRKSFTIDELDHLEIKYGEKYGADKLTEVPSYLVSSQVYQKLSKQIYGKHTTGASTKEKAVISKMYGSMYKSGISSVIKSSLNEAHDVRANVMEMDFDSAIKAGNREAAIILADTARDTGLWDSDKYLAKTKDMPDRIAQSNYLNDLNRSEDPVILNAGLDSLLVDTDLKSATKNSLFRRYESKIKDLESEADEIVTDQKKKASYETFVNQTTDILKNGEPMPWGQVGDVARGMEPTDGKGLITLNRIVGEKGVVTDPKTQMGLTVQIRSLSLPRDGTSIYQRRESAVNNLIKATGHDPITGEKVGPSKINPADFAKLWGDINKSQAFAYDNPEVKRVSDQVWLSLTGASKDMLSSVLGEGPNVINAVQAERDLLAASRQIGPGFNPDAWWKKNGTRYVTSALEDNEKTLKENKLDKYIVTDINDPGLMNMKKTAQGIADRVKSKSMTQQDGERAMKDLNEIYRLRLERMRFLDKEAK